MYGALFLAGTLIVVLAVWWLERRNYNRRLAGLKLRIYVNGIRGKSTVTRLVAGVLREAGIQTLAKTTGSAAMVFSLIVAFDPPIRAFGIKPKLLALAVERPIYESDPWTIGLRAYGQMGSVDGAYTCPSSVVAFTPGSLENPYGCTAESSDTATLRYLGGEVSVAHEGLGRWKLSPHIAVGVNYFNTKFQVQAPTFGFIDHTLYTSHGFTVSGDIGVSYRLSGRLELSVDSLYTPLWVNRPSTGRYLVPFYNVRALFSYRIR